MGNNADKFTVIITNDSVEKITVKSRRDDITGSTHDLVPGSEYKFTFCLLSTVSVEVHTSEACRLFKLPPDANSLVTIKDHEEGIIVSSSGSNEQKTLETKSKQEEKRRRIENESNENKKTEEKEKEMKAKNEEIENLQRQWLQQQQKDADLGKQKFDQQLLLHKQKWDLDEISKERRRHEALEDENRRQQKKIKEIEEQKCEEEQRKQKKKTENAQEIERLKSILEEIQTSLKQAIEENAECAQILTTADELVKKEEESLKELTLDLHIEEEFKKVKDLKKKVQQTEEEISKIINSTGVAEGYVVDFLNLTNALLPETLNMNVLAQDMNNNLNNVYELLMRRLQDKKTIPDYFVSKSLGAYAKVFMEAIGGEFVEDIQISSEEFKTEILPVLEEEMKTKLKIMDRKNLEKICTGVDTRWKDEQDELSQNNREILSQLSSPLSLFFYKLYDGINNANILLELNSPENWNIEQQKIIKLNPDTIKLKQITYDYSENDENADNKNEKSKQELEINDFNLQIHGEIASTLVQNSESLNELNDLFHSENVQIKEIKQEEVHITNLELTLDTLDTQVINLINKTSDQMTVVSLDKMDIVKTIPELKQHGEAFAVNVQDTCMKMLLSRNQLRKSILLVQEILQLKPANIEPETTSFRLWKAVDQGCSDIVKSTLEMTKVSSKYFSFFLRFKSSLDVCSKILQNPKSSLSVATSELTKDMKEFLKFQNSFDIAVNNIADGAHKTLTDIIQNIVGAKHFQQCQKQLKQQKDEYLQQYNNYITAKQQFKSKQDEIRDKITKNKAEKLSAQYKFENNKATIDNLKRQYEQYAGILYSFEQAVLNIEHVPNRPTEENVTHQSDTANKHETIETIVKDLVSSEL